MRFAVLRADTLRMMALNASAGDPPTLRIQRKPQVHQTHHNNTNVFP